MGKLNAYAGLFSLVAAGLLVYFVFVKSDTSSKAGKATIGSEKASFLGRKRR